MLEHDPGAVACALVLERQQRTRQSVRLGKLKFEGRIHMRRGDTLHALERLQPALRLARLARFGAEALDEGLHVFDLALLARVESGVLGKLRSALLFEGGVVAPIRVGSAVLYIDDAV